MNTIPPKWLQPKSYTNEMEIVADILIEFGALPWIRVERNNVGTAYGIGIVAQFVKNIRVAITNPHRIREILDWFRNQRPIKFGNAGEPDIRGFLTGNANGIHRGRAVYIEAKMPGEKLDPDQVTWRDMAVPRGVLHIVAHSVLEVYQGLQAAGVAW